MSKVESIINSVNNMSTQGLKVAKGMQFTPTEYQVDNRNAKAWEKLGMLADWAQSKANEQERDISERLRMQYGPELAQMYREGRVPANLNKATVRGIKFRAAQEDAARIADMFNQRIAKGDFNNVDDMQRALHDERADSRKSLALQYGWSADDTDFLDGYAQGNDRLGMELVGNFLKYQSGKTESVQQMQTSQLQARVFEQPSLMYSGKAAEAIAQQMQQMYDVGETNFNTVQTMVYNSVNSAVAYEGGVNYLEALEKQQIRVEGFSGSYKDFIGADKWELLKAKAGQTQANLDAKFTEDVELKLAQVASMNDLNQASQLVSDIKSQVNARFGNERMNQYRSSIIAVEKQLIAKQQAQIVAIQKETLAKQLETEDDAIVMRRYTEVEQGGVASLDYNMIPNMSKERFISAANRMVKNIQNSQILTPEEKAFQLSEKLRVDRQDGPITAIMKDTADRAMTEYGSMILNGALPSDPKYSQSFNTMKAMYDANPSLISMKFPDLAAKLFAMEQATALGVPEDVFIQYQHQVKDMSKEMKYESDREWADTVNKSPFMGLTYLPKELSDAARIVYETTLATTRGGDEGTRIALKAAGEFAKKVSWKYEADKTTGKYSQDTYGAIPKSFLQTDTTLESVQVGQDYIGNQVDTLKKLAPNQNIYMRYVQSGDYVLLRASNGMSKRIYKEDLVGALIDLEDFTVMDKARKERELINKSKQRQLQGQQIDAFTGAGK